MIDQAHPQVLAAIENNRKALMRVLERIRRQTRGELLAEFEALPDQEEYPELTELETLVVANYVVAFLTSQLTDVSQFSALLDKVFEAGMDAGLAHDVLVRSTPN